MWDLMMTQGSSKDGNADIPGIVGVQSSHHGLEVLPLTVEHHLLPVVVWPLHTAQLSQKKHLAPGPISRAAFSAP